MTKKKSLPFWDRLFQIRRGEIFTLGNQHRINRVDGAIGGLNIGDEQFCAVNVDDIAAITVDSQGTSFQSRYVIICCQLVLAEFIANNVVEQNRGQQPCGSANNASTVPAGKAAKASSVGAKTV